MAADGPVSAGQSKSKGWRVRPLTVACWCRRVRCLATRRWERHGSLVIMTPPGAHRTRLTRTGPRRARKPTDSSALGTASRAGDDAGRRDDEASVSAARQGAEGAARRRRLNGRHRTKPSRIKVKVPVPVTGPSGRSSAQRTVGPHGEAVSGDQRPPAPRTTSRAGISTHQRPDAAPSIQNAAS